MSYLSNSDLKDLGFKSLGKEVKISSKASIYNPETISIDDYSRIDDFCVVSGHVTVGKYMHIAPMCLVAGGTAGITLEDFSGLAYGVKLFAQSDDYSGNSMTNPLIPKAFKKEKVDKILVKKHTIIGAGSVVMPGITLNEGTAVGALSLITKDTEEWSIYFGNPARRLKTRSKKLLDLEKEFLEGCK